LSHPPRPAGKALGRDGRKMSKGIELTERKLEGKVVAGIDTHADTHWLCVLDKR